VVKLAVIGATVVKDVYLVYLAYAVAVPLIWVADAVTNVKLPLVGMHVAPLQA